MKVESLGGHAWGLISASWKRSTWRVKVDGRQLNGTFWTRKCLARIFPQRLNDHLSVTHGLESLLWNQTKPAAVLLPPNSRSRKAQRRPTNNTEAVLWIWEALRYQEKEEYWWPHLDDGEVRHGETDFILSVLGEREPGMSGRGGSSFSSFREGEERKIHC